MLSIACRCPFRPREFVEFQTRSIGNARRLEMQLGQKRASGGPFACVATGELSWWLAGREDGDSSRCVTFLDAYAKKQVWALGGGVGCSAGWLSLDPARRKVPARW